MRLCLPARMGGGGKAESTPWRGPAGAQRPPLGGGYSALGTRGQSPWRSRLFGNGAVRLPLPQRGIGNGTVARRDAGGWSARATVRQRPSDKKRGKSASGSSKKRRTLRSAKRGIEYDPRKSRSVSCAPDRHPKGRDSRLGSRQRIERVAVRQRHNELVVQVIDLHFREWQLQEVYFETLPPWQWLTGFTNRHIISVQVTNCMMTVFASKADVRRSIRIP